MSTLRISNIEAKSVPASATIDEKVKITNSSGDVLVFLDGKTSGITTVGINTTDGNITFDANSNVVVTGIITASKFVGTFEPTNLTLTGDLLVPDKIVHTGDTNTAIRFPAADTISFETSGGERLRIDSRGDVYLSESTSLSSPYSSFHNLSIGNNLILNAYTGGNGGFAGMQQNAYVNSGGSWTKVYDDYAFSIGGDDGNIFFRTAGTGTGSITWSTPLKISNGGHVLIHTSTEGLGTYGEELTIGSPGGDHAGMTIRTGTGHKGTIYFSDGTSGDAEYRGAVQYDHSDDTMRIATSTTNNVVIKSHAIDYFNHRNIYQRTAGGTHSIADGANKQFTITGLGYGWAKLQLAFYGEGHYCNVEVSLGGLMASGGTYYSATVIANGSSSNVDVNFGQNQTSYVVTISNNTGIGSLHGTALFTGSGGSAHPNIAVS